MDHHRPLLISVMQYEDELNAGTLATPDPTRALLDCHRLRIAAKPLGIMRIDASADSIQVQFIPNPPIDPLKIIQLIQSSREYSLSGQDRLKILVKIEDVNKRVMRIKELVKKLG